MQSMSNADYRKPSYGSRDGHSLPLAEGVIREDYMDGFPVITLSVRLEYAPGHPARNEGQPTPILDPRLSKVRAAIVEHLGDKCGFRG